MSRVDLGMSLCTMVVVAAFSQSLQVSPSFAQQYVVMVAPGHGGSDSGSPCPATGELEKDRNLEVGNRLLDNLYFNALLNPYTTRVSDVFIDLPEQVTMARDQDTDFFVSVHHNQPIADGTETIYSSRNQNGDCHPFARYSEILADKVQWQLLRNLVLRDRLVKDRDLYVLRYAEWAAVLGEASGICENISLFAEADAYAKAIEDFRVIVPLALRLEASIGERGLVQLTATLADLDAEAGLPMIAFSRRGSGSATWQWVQDVEPNQFGEAEFSERVPVGITELEYRAVAYPSNLSATTTIEIDAWSTSTQVSLASANPHTIREGSPVVRFDVGSTIVSSGKVYNTRGELVGVLSTASDASMWEWDTTGAGQRVVQNGVYYCVLRTNFGKQTVKISVLN